MAKELYVGHLSEQVTEDDLRNLFSVMGVVTSVHLIVDPQSGEFKRCGYVRMLSGVDLNEVVETLDGAFLIDRVITVSVAKPQKERPAKSAGAGKRPAGGSGGRAGGPARPPAPGGKNKRPGGSTAAHAAAGSGAERKPRPAASGRPEQTGRAAGPRKGPRASGPRPGGSPRSPSRGRS